MFSNNIIAKNSVLSKTGSVLLAVYIVAVSFAGVTAMPQLAQAADGAQLTVLINGQSPTGYCIAGPITVSGTGLTGGQGGKWHLSIGWGNSTTTSDATPSIITSGSVNQKQEAFTYSATNNSVTGSITVVLYHSQPSGQDGQIIVVNQCVAAPTEGVVVLAKNVINDNSGTSIASAFTLTVNGSNVTGSVAGGMPGVLLTAGTYPITETGPAGYTRTKTECFDGTATTTTNGTSGSVTVVAGKNYKCTITNDDNAPTLGGLVVQKVVVGGTAQAGDFPISVKTAGDAHVAGSPASGSSIGTEYTLTTGSYTVSEPVNAHYSSAITGTNCTGGNAVVALGATTTCVVTNTYHNAAPTADDLVVATNEDAPVAGAVTGGDTDGDVFTFGFLTAPTNGTLTGPLNPNTGAFTYTPNANFFGSDSFTFNTTDGVGTSASATVTINIASVNDAPVANNDATNVNQDAASTTINVLANDTDVDGGPLTITSITAPANGTADTNGSTVDYKPAAGYVGLDSFTYTISDGNGGTASATVNITVDNVNDAPVAAADGYNTNEDVALVVAAPGVLGNDSDADANSLTAIKMSEPANGSVTLNSDGSFTYTPNADFNGGDSFTYKANDGSADSSTVVVTITVDPINDVPVASNSAIETDQNAATSSNLIATDTEGSALTYDVIMYPSNGWFSMFASSTGAFTYSPTFGYLGSDSFTFKANDGSDDSNTATVSIIVNAVSENTFAKCTDGIDNDGDEAIDLADEDCAEFLPTLTVVKNTTNGNGSFGFTVQNMDAFPVATVGGTGQETVVLGNVSSTNVSENQTQGWEFDSLQCSVENESVDFDYDGSYVSISDISAGDTITCTFVNTKLPQCSDGIDNDEDGFTDYGAEGDNNCLNPQDDNESAEGTTQCSDGADNDSDGTSDINDPGCHNDNNANNPFSYIPSDDNESDLVDLTPQSGGGGGGGGGGNGPISGNLPINGQVLGASTSLPELPAGCSALLHTYMRQGRRANSAQEVRTLQTFLNEQMAAGLPVTGYFGPMTDKAVRAFQTKHTEQVLTPWNLAAPTGFVYLTTQRWINLIHCASLNIPVPTLVPFQGE